MIYDKMDECFASIDTKLEYALNNTDLEKIYSVLDEIKGNTIVTGLGGSSIVATFLSKVLREKNRIPVSFNTPRDLAYMDLSTYQNVIAVSYSGNNLGVKLSFDNDLNHYLFTGNPQADVQNMVYNMMKETSYVSINATIVPLSIILLYYINDRKLLKEIIDREIQTSSHNDRYEVMTGYETITASTLLESSFIESGIGTCIVHDKYNYCHGRINITKNSKADMIIFDTDNELDSLLKKELERYYDIIVIPKRYDDVIINDFYSTIISLKLIHQIAINRNIDISDMDELENNDKLYLFNGKVK